MPDRFPHLERAQAREVAIQIDALSDDVHQRVYRLWLRMMLITTVLVLAVLITSVIALDVYAHSATRADLNHAQAQELKDARNLAYQNCLRSQDSRRALRTLIFVTIPRHDPHRSMAEAMRVAGFYQRLAQNHVLDIPRCNL